MRGQLRASLTCGPDGYWTNADGYATFASSDAADEVFDAYTANGGAFCKTPTTWSINGRAVGRVACYQTTNGGTSNGTFAYAIAVWTYRPLHLFGWAYDNGNDPASLMEWWNRDAGPTRAPDTVAGLPSPADARGNALRLAARLRRSTRTTCAPAALDRGQFDGEVFRWRLWIDGALACRPRSGADHLFYLSVAPDALTNFFYDRYSGRVTDAQTAANEGAATPCPAEFVYTMDDQPTGDTEGTGRIACFSANGKSVVGWTVRDRHALAEATGSGSASLLRFAAEAGPQPTGRFQPARFLKPG